MTIIARENQFPREMRLKSLVFQSSMGKLAAEVNKLLEKFYVILFYVMVSSFFDYDRPFFSS